MAGMDRHQGELGIVLVVLSSAIAAGLSLIFSPVWPLIFVALVPLLLALEKAASSRKAMVLGLVWGAGLMGTSLSFVFAMLPLDWLGMSEGLLGISAVAALWAATTCFLAAPVAIFALVVWRIRHAPAPLIAVVVPLVWTLLECARAILYSMLAIGPGTSIGPFFTFGFLGYALAGASGLLQLAPLGGPLALGWFAALTNTALYLILRTLPAAPLRVAGGAGAVAVLWFLNAVLPPRVEIEVGANAAHVNETLVALVHTHEAARFAMTAQEEAAARVRLASTISRTLTDQPTAQVVVVPEGSTFTGSAASPPEREAAAALASRGALLIGSRRSSDGEAARSVLYAYDAANQAPIQVSAKSYLVPFGEYVPHVLADVGRVFGFEEQVEVLADKRASFRPAPWHPEERLVRWQGVTFGVLACSEMFYPYFSKDVADAGADAIVVLSSQSWVRGASPVLFNQLRAMAVVNAAWVGKPWLQATNGAPNVVVTTKR
jgi:apolipoprotein N-acyltransferase